VRQNGWAQIRQVDTIHFTATTPDGRELAVVSYTDGRCGITRDGEPIEGLDWPIDCLNECTEWFAQLAGLSK
jgi:hypothetical protein